MEYRFCAAPTLLEKREDSQPIMRGHAAVYYDGTPATEYGLWENTVERIMPGAFDRAIKEDDVRALFNHDANMVLGRLRAGTLRLDSDATGLAYEVDLPDTRTGRDLEVLLGRGDVTGSSFSFVPTDEEWRKESGVNVRQVTAVRLYDVGPVTFPAYTATDASMRHAEGAKKMFEEWQREQVERAARARRIRLRLIEIG